VLVAFTFVPSSHGLSCGFAELDARGGPFLDVARHHQQAIDDQREAIDLGICGLELSLHVGVQLILLSSSVRSIPYSL
jgi:hypothetical protein